MGEGREVNHVELEVREDELVESFHMEPLSVF